ncbi:hypothetical protein Cs7R123_25400 [Catellatospora sp. TT07R-123]|uniref:T6SS immunity protein Tdi1 domain-containing protein n=1 Tax=Catellatospora sp. TT07R-123 TaxID=2733863 RepID=UPI001B0BD6FA|nr:T6SS immunity protein Tdi1 domain-containing protein [Catellatospora sp. TT07R-123]GHJ45198.1 hypothetical protein Cs7R123_25400 [Catellatospora sp. TT07R-123]
MQLTKTFTDEQYARALESWAWLDLAGRKPVFTSLFGDVFLAGTDGVSYLDVIEGRLLTAVWPTGADLEASLNTEEGEDRYLLGGLALGAQARGLTLGPDQVFTFMPPPVLGGKVGLETIEVADFVMAVDIAGQIHDQVRAMPPGASINIKIA